MFIKFYMLWVLIIGANASAEYRVLHSPSSLKFSGSSKILESFLKEIISACLGLSVDENTEWKGLYVLDPFSTPEAAVQINVDGISSLGNNVDSNVKVFPLAIDDSEPETYKAVEHRINQRFGSGGNKLVNIKLLDPNEFTSQNFVKVFGKTKVPRVSKQPLENLKYSVEEDYQFLNELQAMKAITAKVLSGAIGPDNIVDFYNLHFGSLHALSDFHGPNSLQTDEAKSLLVTGLQDLSKAFVKAYAGSVLVTAVVSDIAHKRRVVRSPDEESEEIPEPTPEPSEITEATTTGSNQGNGGAGDEFDGDFPVMFNILLWFGVAYFFSLLAIVYTIMEMDPGRDSIIYRMTNIRFKKDV